MLLFDLAVPRDIEPEVARLPDAYLHTLDDLAACVAHAGAHRHAAVHDAEALIDDRRAQLRSTGWPSATRCR